MLNPEHDDFTKVIAAPPEPLGHQAVGTEDLLVLAGHRHCFLSHASEDKQSIARPLYNALTLAGIACWFAEVEMSWGQSVAGGIQDGLAKSRYLLAVVTPNFVKKNWTVTELNIALHQEINEGRVIVLPVIAATSDEKEAIFAKLGLLRDKLYLEWTGDPTPVIRKMKQLLELPD